MFIKTFEEWKCAKKFRQGLWKSSNAWGKTNVCSNPAICYLRRIVSRISRNRPYAFYGVHASCYRSAFVFLMHAWINLVYFGDTTICMFAQLIHPLGRWTIILFGLTRLISQHWTPFLWQKTVYTLPMATVLKFFALLDCHTAFVYRRFGTAETSVSKYQLTLSDELGERRLHTHRGGARNLTTAFASCEVNISSVTSTYFNWEIKLLWTINEKKKQHWTCRSIRGGICPFQSVLKIRGLIWICGIKLTNFSIF